MKKALTLVLALTMLVGVLAGCQSAASSTPASTGSTAAGSSSTAPGTSAEGTMVAAIFGGAINDGNWNQTQYNGLMNIGALGAETAFVENTSDTDAAQAARDYATAGFQLIYLTTNSYQDYCTPVAADFPDATFVSINGTIVQDNYISVRIADEEQGFMMGVAAALLSKTGKVGFVGGLEINPIKLGATGFQQGVDYVNENYGLSVEATIINTGSFTDVNQAKETAIAMIDSGCDVVTPMANDAGVGVMEAAEEKGVMAIASGIGQEASAPTATQLTVVKDVAVAYDVTFAAFLDGSLKATTEVEKYGANRGVVFLTGDDSLESEISTRLNEVMEKLKNNEITIDLTV